MVLCVEAASSHIAVDGFPLLSEAFGQAVCCCPMFQVVNAFIDVVVVEILHQELDISGAMLCAGAINPSKGGQVSTLGPPN